MNEFLAGAARALDLGATGSRYDVEIKSIQSDYDAIKSDWEIVGGHIHGSMNKQKGVIMHGITRKPKARRGYF